MPHPLNSISEQAWNAIKLPHQPDYDGLGVEFRATLFEWATYALSGQPIEEGYHPGAKFKRKIVELNGQAFIDASEISADDPHLFIPGLPIQKIPVTIEGDTVHVPSFELPSTVPVLPEVEPVNILEDPPDVTHLKGPLPIDFPYYDKLAEAGIKTHPQLRKALDSGVHIPGIGPAAEAKIADRLVLEAQK